MNRLANIRSVLYGSVLGVLVVSAMYGSTVILASVTDPLPEMDFVQLLINSIGGLPGASAMGIALLATQIVMAFFRTDLADFSGKGKLIFVTVLNIVGCVLGLRIAGLSWAAALLHSTTLNAYSVFGHQLIKQFKESQAPGLEFKDLK